MLAQGRAQRRPGYGVRQREIALKGQNSSGSVVCVGTVCSAPSGQWGLRAIEHPGRRCALPWAAMYKPVGLKSVRPKKADLRSILSLCKTEHYYGTVTLLLAVLGIATMQRDTATDASMGLAKELWLRKY